MSNELYHPKATFTVAKDKAGKRVFTAVNKRAKRVVKAAGKRKYVTVEQLKALVDKGSYVFYAYTDKGLVKIRF